MHLLQSKTASTIDYYLALRSHMLECHNESRNTLGSSFDAL